MDKFLAKLNGTTLLELWGNDTTILKVTLADVLHMKSGIQDYNDSLVWDISMKRPGYDMPPQEFLHVVNKSFVCAPGTCLVYSSINFVLAGMVLAQATGCSSWEELDQKAFLGDPAGAWQQKYANVTFAKRGPCSQYPNMVHSYAWDHTVDNATKEDGYTDMYDASCLNGWTMGNIAISAKDTAQFYYDLLGAPYGFGGTLAGARGAGLVPSVVSGFGRWKVSQLERIGPEDPWGEGIHYGYGIFDVMPGFDNEFIEPGLDRIDNDLIGHAGADYGTYLEGGFHPALNVAMAIGVNKDNFFDENTQDHIFCLAYRAIFAVVGNTTVTCPKVGLAGSHRGRGGRSRARRPGSGRRI